MATNIFTALGFLKALGEKVEWLAPDKINTENFNKENLRRKKKKVAGGLTMVRSFAIDAEKLAVIKQARIREKNEILRQEDEHIAAANDAGPGKSRQYTRPFMVTDYDNPRRESGRVSRHARGGTEAQRTLLNSFAAAGNETAVQRALETFGSPSRIIRAFSLKKAPGDPK